MDAIKEQKHSKKLREQFEKEMYHFNAIDESGKPTEQYILWLESKIKQF